MGYASASARLCVAAIAVAAATGACSKDPTSAPETRRAASVSGPSLARTEVSDIARTAALGEGLKLSLYGPPQVSFEVFDGRGRWVVFYPGIEDKPGNFFNVIVDDATRSADVFGGE